MLWSCGLPLKLVDTNTLARTSKHRTYVHRVAYCLSKRRHAWSNMTRVEQVNAANEFHLNLYQRLQITPITSQWPEHFVTAWNDDPAALDLLWGAELKKSGGGGTCSFRSGLRNHWIDSLSTKSREWNKSALSHKSVCRAVARWLLSNQHKC